MIFLLILQLRPGNKFIITPDSESYWGDQEIMVCGLLKFLNEELAGGE